MCLSILVRVDMKLIKTCINMLGIKIEVKSGFMFSLKDGGLSIKTYAQ